MRRAISIMFIFGFAFIRSVSGQGIAIHHFSFSISHKAQLDSITRYISIDKVSGLAVEAYANPKEFAKFLSWNIPYSEIAESKDAKVVNMANTVAEMANWNRYPTYEVYVEMMQNFASNYPSICELQEIGMLASGRKLLVLKISDNVQSNNETEPELLYTSSIHGDEVTGFVLLLRLIDELLSQYGNVARPEITKLVNNAEIWINPLANPDGAYCGGNSTVSNAIRYNANLVDLNRNFADADGTLHPDGNAWQEETLLMMQFAQNHHFALSANFHGGAEVVNYPWDTWSRRAADDAWWQQVSGEYAGLVHANSPSGYFTDLDNGITNGYDWYTIHGGRQDYMNFFHGCRAVTIELSSTKMVSTDELPNYWDYQSSALLYYLNQGLYGVQGTITDIDGNPLHAKIYINGHDSDSSWVYTDAGVGDYARFLKAGEYSLTFSAHGYQTQIINNVSVVDSQLTTLNVVLFPPRPVLSLNKDSIAQYVVMHKTVSDTLLICNVGFADLNYQIQVSNTTSNTWLTLSRNSGVVPSLQNQAVVLNIDADSLLPGQYNCSLLISGDSSLIIPVELQVDTIPYFNDIASEMTFHVYVGESDTTSMQLRNLGGGILSYTTQITYVDGDNWLLLSNMQGSVNSNQTNDIVYTVNSTNLVENTYRGLVTFYSEFDTIEQTVLFVVETLPPNWLNKEQLVEAVCQGQIHVDSVELTNWSDKTIVINEAITYQIGIDWLVPSIAPLELQANQSLMLYYVFDARNLSLGYYSAVISYGLLSNEVVNVSLYVVSEPVLEVYPLVINKIMAVDTQTDEDVLIQNTSGTKLDYNLYLEYDDNDNWLSVDSFSGTVLAGDSAMCQLTFNTQALNLGVYSAKLVVSTLQTEKRIPITLTVENAPEVKLSDSIFNYRFSDGIQNGAFYLSNTGGSSLNYHMSIAAPADWLVIESPLSGELLANHSAEIIFQIAPVNPPDENQLATLNIETNAGNCAVSFILDAGLGISLDKPQVLVYPNPFANEVCLQFNNATDPASVNIYNVLGKRIAQAHKSSSNINQATFYWKGCNAAGKPVPNGTYIFHYQSKKQTITGKLQKQ